MLYDYAGRPIEYQEPQPPKPAKGEIAGSKDDIYRAYVGKILTNPDQVLRKESKAGLDLYREMMDKDAQISSLMQTRVNGVVSKNWDINPASEETRDVEIADFVRSALDNIDFEGDMKDLLQAIGLGYYPSEVMWRPPGEKVAIEDIRGRNPRRFTFDIDGKMRLLTRGNMVNGIELPERKFLVHTFDPRDEDPYGTAVMRKCYWPWWFKKNAIKFAVIFAEKFGMPTVKGIYPPGADADSLLDILKAIQQETALVVPEGTEIDLLEAQRRGTVDIYKFLIEEFANAELAKAILGQTLTSSEGRHGTQALGSVHWQVRQDILEGDAKSLMGVINNQLISWLVDFNFTGIDKYPSLKIEYEEPEDLQALAERDSTLVKDIGLPLARKYFYERYGLPEPEEGEELVSPSSEGNAVADIYPSEYAEGGRFTADQASIEELVEASMKQADDVVQAMREEIMDTVRGSASLEDARDRILEAYSEMDQTELEDLILRAMFIAEQYGRNAIADED